MDYVMQLAAADSTLNFQTDHIIPSLNMHLGNDNVNFYMRTAGYKFGVGTSSPKTSMSLVGALSIEERADHETTNAGWGQLWVKNDSPNKLYFTDDAGTDHDLTAGGGSTSPGGSDTQVQYNNGGAFAGSSNMTFNGTNLTLASNLLLGSNLVHNGDTDTYLGFETDNIRLYAGNTNTMNIKADGVGIGTNSPGYKLDVRDSVSFRFEQSASQRLLFFGQNDHATIHVTGSSHKLAFQTGGPGVEFQDAAGNHHLTVLETGTNGARIHGPALVQLKSDADSVYITAAEHNYFDVGAGATYSHIWRDDTNGETMRLKNGQLGIGTNAPNQALDVAGNITTNALDTEYRFGNRSDLLIRGHSDFDMELISPQDMAFSIDSDNNETAHKFLFKTNTTTPRSAGTTLMEISEAGDVSIAGGLTVTGTSTFNDHITIAENKELRFDSSDSFIKADTDNPEDLEIHADDDIFLNPDDDVFIQNDGNTYVSFDGANRRVGIGEISPDDLLHLKGSSNVDIRLEDSDATGMGNMDTMIRGFRQSTEAWFLGTESGAGTLKLGITTGHTSDLALHTAGSERLRVTDAGKVGIGTTAPDTLLHVAGALTSSPTKMITSMTTEGNPGTTRTVNVTEDIFQYIGQVVDGGIVAFELPSSPDIGETYRIVWETRNAFGIGPINSVVKLTRAASSIQINGSTSDLTLKSNSSTNTFRGIAEVVCIDNGTGLAGAVAYVVQNTEV